MENSLGQRIILVQKWSGLKPGDFAKTIGILRTQLYRYNDGSQMPNFTVLYNMLLKFPQISPQWLMLGVGEMIIQKDTKGVVKEGEASYTVKGKSGAVDADAELLTMLKGIKEAISTYIYRAENK